MKVEHRREAYRYVAELLASALRLEGDAPLPLPVVTPEVREALEQIRTAMRDAGAERAGR